MNTRLIIPDSQLIDMFNREVNDNFSLLLENRKWKVSLTISKMY